MVRACGAFPAVGVLWLPSIVTCWLLGLRARCALALAARYCLWVRIVAGGQHLTSMR
jgi:hypothetical protein